MYFTSKQIGIAKQINLADFLISKGEDLKSEGKYYRIGKSSFVIKNNVYFRNSKNEIGSTIDFLIRYRNCNFTSALKELFDFSRIKTNSLENKECKIKDIEFTKDIRKSIAYLCQHRKIDKTIIKLLIDRKLITQTKENNNICFKILDENKTLVGGELNTSLSFKRFKGFLPGSKNSYGFNITPQKWHNIRSVCYFESAIDLLSFLTIIGYERFVKSLESTGYISMGGLKINVIRKTKKLVPGHQIFLGTDNINVDEPSNNFCKLVSKEYSINYLKIRSNYKDWNDCLVKTKGS